MNEEHLICYGFTFTVSVKSKTGKIYNAHRIPAIGLSYSLACWDMKTTLKSRGMQLLKINAVSVDRIEFALSKDGQPLDISLSESRPAIPENLNIYTTDDIP